MSVEQQALLNKRGQWAGYQLVPMVARLLLVGLAYFVLASLGLQLASINPSVTPIWPPTGLAIAVILLWGYRVAPAIFVAAFLVNQLTAGSLFSSLAIASGNTLEAILASYLTRSWAGGNQVFDTPGNIAKFALISSAATAIAATIGAASLALVGYLEPDSVAPVWLTWWLGDLAGALVVTPVVLLWGTSKFASLPTGQITRTAATVLAAGAVGIIAFSPWIQQTSIRDALAFLAIAPLLWAALRGGTRDTATVACVISGFAVWGTLMNAGPFAKGSLNDSFILLLVFMISTALPSLALSAEVSVRRRMEKQQRQRALEADVLWQATNQMAAGASFEDLLRGCLERICLVSGWPAGHAYLPDDASAPTHLVQSSVWHFEREDLFPLAYETADAALGFGEGLPGEIWASGKSQWITRIADSANLPRKDVLLKHGLNSAFGFPLYVDGRLRAVFEFFSAATQPPDEHLLYIVQSIGEQLGRVLERQRAQEQQAVLLRELSHRVGNSLAVLQAVFRRSVQHASSFQELQEAFEGRVTSLAAAHRLLSEAGWQSTSLRKLVRAVVTPYCSADSENCEIVGDEAQIQASMVLSLTMILHELATNAAKHGAFNSRGGKVMIEWSQHRTGDNAKCLQFHWRETGAVNATRTKSEGYGNLLIDSTVSALGGSVTRNFVADGLSVQLSLPLTQIAR